MKIQYLGTAAAEGWPAVFCGCEACKKARALGGKNIRTRAQALLDEKLLLDLGPDTYFHTLQYGLCLEAVASVLVTHAHQDHFYPLELLLRSDPYAHTPAAAQLTVYGSAHVKAVYEDAVRIDDGQNFAQRVRFETVTEFVPFETAEGYTVTPLLANHAKNEKCLVYLVEKGGKRLFYAHDSGLYPDATWEYLKGRHLDLVSFDCTSVCGKDGMYHMGLPDNREAKQKLVALGCADETTQFVVTHFSHNGALMHDEIAREAAQDGFAAAYDGMAVEF